MDSFPFHEKATFDELRTSFRGLREACLDNPYVHVSNFNELIPYEGTYLARRYRRDYGNEPPPNNPWFYSDDRVLVVRDWVWRFSVALWPVTGLVFNAIQRPEYQRDLWRTLPVKNAEFISFAEETLRLASSNARPSVAARHYRMAVERAVRATHRTTIDWPAGAPKEEMLSALNSVNAERALNTVS